MISAEDIEQAVSEQFQTLRAQVGLDFGLRRYDSEGGQQSDHPWQTTGFYVQENPRSRLVLEVFRYQTGEIAVVRVYREQRLRIFYARKLLGGTQRLPIVLAEASDAFRVAAPRKPFREQDLDLSRLPGGMAAQLNRLMGPVPPPIDFSRIKEG